jgi:hypothetical protein
MLPIRTHANDDAFVNSENVKTLKNTRSKKSSTTSSSSKKKKKNKKKPCSEDDSSVFELE